MHFLDTNAVILKNPKYLLKCVCIYRENNPNGEFLSNFLQVSKFVLYCSTNGRGYPELSYATFRGKLISTRNVF